jgi:hypothetical protein
MNNLRKNIIKQSGKTSFFKECGTTCGREHDKFLNILLSNHQKKKQPQNSALFFILNTHTV